MQNFEQFFSQEWLSIEHFEYNPIFPVYSDSYRSEGERRKQWLKLLTPSQYSSMIDCSWLFFDMFVSFCWNYLEFPLNLSKIDFIFKTFSWRSTIVTLGIFSSARIGFSTIKTYPGWIVFLANIPLPYWPFLISMFGEKY